MGNEFEKILLGLAISVATLVLLRVFAPTLGVTLTAIFALIAPFWVLHLMKVAVGKEANHAEEMSLQDARNYRQRYFDGSL